jgi:hypothetical protein
VAQPDGQEADQALQYVVRPPRAESDLTPLSDQQWDDLSGLLSFTRIDPLRESVASALGAARSARELWLVLMGLTLLLAVVEMALARAWSSPGR